MRVQIAVLVAVILTSGALAAGTPASATSARRLSTATSRCGEARYLLNVQSRLLTPKLSWLGEVDSRKLAILFVTKATKAVCAGHYTSTGCQSHTAAGAFAFYTTGSTDWSDARSKAHFAHQATWEKRFASAMWTTVWDAYSQIIPSTAIRWCDIGNVAGTAWVLDKWSLAASLTQKEIGMIERDPTVRDKAQFLSSIRYSLNLIEHHQHPNGG